MVFKDYFSTTAKDYATFRPKYPESMFVYLSNLCTEHQLAWDCGTGNGQAAIALAEFFSKVIATDPSEKQIQAAIANAKVEYQILPAEKTNLITNSVDLITVAQAMHWFDLDKFYIETTRVLKTGGILATWCYTLPRINSELDKVIDKLYYEITGPYWDNKRKLVDEEYKTIEFPYEKINTPKFRIEESWDLIHFLGYLGTWSGLQTYSQQTKKDPITDLTPEFLRAWDDPIQKKTIQWPIHLLVGAKKHWCINT